MEWFCSGSVALIVLAYALRILMLQIAADEKETAEFKPYWVNDRAAKNYLFYKKPDDE
jgi:hypothetical protein